MRTLFALLAAVAVTAAVSACSLYVEGSSSSHNNNVLPDASSPGEPDAEIIPPEDAGGPINDGGDCCGTPDADPVDGGCGGADAGVPVDAGEVTPDAAY